ANQYHGSLFEYLRNSAVDARSPFDGPTLPPFQPESIWREHRRSDPPRQDFLLRVLRRPAAGTDSDPIRADAGVSRRVRPRPEADPRRLSARSNAGERGGIYSTSSSISSTVWRFPGTIDMRGCRIARIWRNRGGVQPRLYRRDDVRAFPCRARFGPSH